MTPQELKASVLWNAIQGKLTSQFDHECIGDVIKDVPLSAVPDDEVYCKIPSNWRWGKIKDIFSLVNGKAFKPSDWCTSGLPIVRIQNLNDLTAPYNYCSNTVEEKYRLHGGELLFSWSGTPGTSFGAFIWNGGEAALNQHIFIVYPKIDLDYQYAKHALNGEIQVFIDKAHGGAGLKHITKKEFENCVLPIPPRAEQKRIVAKIEELLPLIDRYEQAWSKLENFNKRFPIDMQKSILQMAIQGNLVEQRPEEGTGEELYQQIQAEKQALIKAGTIKKQKPLPEIKEDEIPFDIPETWKWVSVGNVCVNIQYGSSKKSAPTGKVAVLRMGNIQNGKLLLDKLVYTSDDEEIEKHPLQYDDLLFNRTNSKDLVGKTAIYKGEIPAIYAGYLVRLTPLLMDSDYLNYVMQSQFYWNYCQTVRSDAIGQSNINAEKLKRFVFPLPPLAEQKRIVAKLEELLPLCDRLK